MGMMVGNPLVDELARRYGVGNVWSSIPKASGLPPPVVPGSQGWSASYAQGPLPIQPPREVMSGGGPRLEPFNPQPRYVPPPINRPPVVQAMNASSTASQVPALMAINSAAPSVLQGKDVTPRGTVEPPIAGFPFGYAPAPGSYPMPPPLPSPIDPRLPAVLRSIMPGLGSTTNPRMYGGFDPNDIVRRSAGTPPIPQMADKGPNEGATVNGQPITLASVLSFLQRPSVRQANSPVMAAMNGKPSNFANPAYIPPGGLANYGGAYQSAFQNGVRDNWDRTQMQADEELRQKRLTGNY